MDSPRVAHEIMVTKLVTLAPETHVSEGISHLLRHNISGAPVVDGDRNYLGVFSEKCCLKVLSVTAQLVGSRDTTNTQSQLVKHFMATRLITLTPEMDVFDCIGYLLKNQISGAPVIGPDQKFLGVFSEKTSMRVLVDSAYNQLPTSRVGAFMNTETKRVISDEVDLLVVMQIFLDTPYRRLPVVRDGKLVGQVSRRDAMRAQNNLAQYLNPREKEYAILEMNLQANVDTQQSEASPSQLLSLDVTSFMDRKARTVSSEMDLFSIAHIFLSTPYRRLPVLDEGKLVGQVSRRDVLQATHDTMAVPVRTDKKMLYLSSIVQREDTPFY